MSIKQNARAQKNEENKTEKEVTIWKVFTEQNSIASHHGHTVVFSLMWMPQTKESKSSALEWEW